MKGRACKTKGKAFERKVAELINQYFGSKARRTPSSGAIQDRFPGDIMDLPPELDVFSIECKNQEKTSVFEWMKQAEQGARIAKKEPLLVFTKNNSPIYAMLSFEFFMYLMGGHSTAGTTIGETKKADDQRTN
jgi:Holliday junction resolvase